jgi:hypothetical protein
MVAPMWTGAGAGCEVRRLRTCPPVLQGRVGMKAGFIGLMNPPTCADAVDTAGAFPLPKEKVGLTPEVAPSAAGAIMG